MKLSASPKQKTNQRILFVSEDRLKGFQRDPIREIARKTNLKPEKVIGNIRAMMKAGAIRRVRQTVMTTSLVPGALVAWKVPEKKLAGAFEFMFRHDPFSGHVVVRSAEYASPAAAYRLWTTLKVPQPFSLEKHCEFLKEKTGAEKFHIMPAKGIFALGVGHSRRKNMSVGARMVNSVPMKKIEIIRLSEAEWKVLKVLKREFKPEEIQLDLWRPRAAEAGMSFENFCKTAEQLDQKGVLGRFSTFLEHSKKIACEEPVAKFHALLQWAAPKGMEEEAGGLIARHRVITHCYWRETPSEFCGVNIMAVIHGDSRDKILKHKAVIDEFLARKRIPVPHTNIFWSEKSEIKPSEFDADVYEAWRRKN